MPLDPYGDVGGWDDEDEEPTGGGDWGWTPPFTGGWMPSTPEGEGGWVEPGSYGTLGDVFWENVYGNPYADTGDGGTYGGGGGGAPGDGGGWGGGGGGGGGGGPAVPQLPPWAGQIPGGAWEQYGLPSALPWQNWQNTPWANVPEGRGAEAQTWMNTVLPWYQQQQAWNQFGQQLGWQQERFGREQDWTQERFGRELGWEQERLQREQEWRARQQAQQRALEREVANTQAFGRRWKPQTRWM